VRQVHVCANAFPAFENLGVAELGWKGVHPLSREVLLFFPFFFPCLPMAYAGAGDAWCDWAGVFHVRLGVWDWVTGEGVL
jgi:hypothetical protein